LDRGAAVLRAGRRAGPRPAPASGGPPPRRRAAPGSRCGRAGRVAVRTSGHARRDGRQHPGPCPCLCLAPAAGPVPRSTRAALAHELHARASVSIANLSDLGFRHDRYHDSLAYLEQSLDLGRRIGDRTKEWFALSEMTYALFMLGRWDEALARLAEIPDEQIG